VCGQANLLEVVLRLHARRGEAHLLHRRQQQRQQDRQHGQQEQQLKQGETSTLSTSHGSFSCCEERLALPQRMRCPIRL
jgi:hypothetical protein